MYLAADVPRTAFVVNVRDKFRHRNGMGIGHIAIALLPQVRARCVSKLFVTQSYGGDRMRDETATFQVVLLVYQLGEAIQLLYGKHLTVALSSIVHRIERNVTACSAIDKGVLVLSMMRTATRMVVLSTHPTSSLFIVLPLVRWQEDIHDLNDCLFPVQEVVLRGFICHFFCEGKM